MFHVKHSGPLRQSATADANPVDPTNLAGPINLVGLVNIAVLVNFTGSVNLAGPIKLAGPVNLAGPPTSRLSTLRQTTSAAVHRPLRADRLAR